MYLNKAYCRKFAVSQTTTSCSSRTECDARHTPHCRLPAFQCARVYWTRKLAAKQSRSKSHGLLSVDSVVANGVRPKFQILISWSKFWLTPGFSEVKPEHTEPNDWSAAKNTEDDYQGEGWLCRILSGLTICVRDRPWFTVSNDSWTKLMHHCQINATMGVLTIYAY